MVTHPDLIIQGTSDNSPVIYRGGVLRLLPEIRRIRDIEQLNMIKQVIKVADDLAEVEASLELPGKAGELSDKS